MAEVLKFSNEKGVALALYFYFDFADVGFDSLGKRWHTKVYILELTFALLPR